LLRWNGAAGQQYRCRRHDPDESPNEVVFEMTHGYEILTYSPAPRSKVHVAHKWPWLGLAELVANYLIGYAGTPE
jgi:hypothetical protein